MSEEKTGIEYNPKLTGEELKEFVSPENNQDIICPFCKDSDFDLIGLKLHIQRGHCEVFEKLDVSSEKKEINNIAKYIVFSACGLNRG